MQIHACTSVCDASALYAAICVAWAGERRPAGARDLPKANRPPTEAHSVRCNGFTACNNTFRGESACDASLATLVLALVVSSLQCAQCQAAVPARQLGFPLRIKWIHCKHSSGCFARNTHTRSYAHMHGNLSSETTGTGHRPQHSRRSRHGHGVTTRRITTSCTGQARRTRAGQSPPCCS